MPLIVLAAACGISPLRDDIAAGEDAYMIFVADGPGGEGDLFAMLADGGNPIQVTFSPIGERAPAVSPNGVMVAFLRGDTAAAGSAWVLNLLSGGERELPLPDGAGPPLDVAWSPDGGLVYVRTEHGDYRFAAPPAPPDPRPAAGAAADSSFAVLLGAPPFGRAERCGNNFCLITRSNDSALLAEAAREAIRWGDDSVGLLVGDRLTVRPLGPGRSRLVDWRPPPNPRGVTFFGGRK